MRVHPIEKIEKLKALRYQGYSINELVAKLDIPKTTVWYHIQGIELLPEHIARLHANQRDNSRNRKEVNIRIAHEKARHLLSGRHRDFAIALAMLYWGDGHKERCDFINTDGAMVKVYLWIMRNVFNVSNDNLMPTLRIFSGMDEKECLNYWSKITQLPKKRFRVRFNDGMTRGRSKYGLCRIVVREGGNILKLLHALIDQFIQEVNQKI